jgi:hyperosmotically inducible protein
LGRPHLFDVVSPETKAADVESEQLSTNATTRRKLLNKLTPWIKKMSVLSSCLTLAVVCAMAQTSEQREKPRDPNASLNSPDSRDHRGVITLGEEVRHQLVTLPYYSVFDWLEANVTPKGEVSLLGEVVRPTTKSDAENRIKSLESVTRVDNKIEVLPLSSMDDQLRVALYRAIFNFNSPLFRYGTAAIPSIHIIVANGHVILKGIVDSVEDGKLAYTAANQVPGVFEVKNELHAAKSTNER